MRLELPGDAWAEMRDPDEVTRRQVKSVRGVMFSTVTVQDGRAVLGSDAMAKTAAIEDAVVLAAVAAWSYGDVTQDALEDVPNGALRVIDKWLADNEFVAKLLPDFGVDPDPESPTPPSAP